MSGGGPRRETVAALVTAAALVAGFSILRPYREPLATAAEQLRLLPTRLDRSLADMQAEMNGEPCRIALWIRGRTPETASILLSDDPRDGRLTSTAWLASYLYPRPLITPAALRRDPAIRVDFVLLTPHFPAALPDSLRGTGAGLLPFRTAAPWLRTEATR